MGNVTRNFIGYPGQLGDIWSRITEGGLFSPSSTKDKYPVRIDHVIHYSDKSAVDGLRYALSYS